MWDEVDFYISDIFYVIKYIKYVNGIIRTVTVQ
jgi:hypothetical protein